MTTAEKSFGKSRLPDFLFRWLFITARHDCLSSRFSRLRKEQCSYLLQMGSEGQMQMNANVGSRRGGVSETRPGFRLTICKNRFFFKNQILVKLVCQLVVLYKSLHCPTLQGSRRSHFRRISQLNAFPLVGCMDATKRRLPFS